VVGSNFSSFFFFSFLFVFVVGEIRWGVQLLLGAPPSPPAGMCHVSLRPPHLLEFHCEFTTTFEPLLMMVPFVAAGLWLQCVLSRIRFVPDCFRTIYHTFRLLRFPHTSLPRWTYTVRRVVRPVVRASPRTWLFRCVLIDFGYSREASLSLPLSFFSLFIFPVTSMHRISSVFFFGPRFLHFFLCWVIVRALFLLCTFICFFSAFSILVPSTALARPGFFLFLYDVYCFLYALAFSFFFSLSFFVFLSFLSFFVLVFFFLEILRPTLCRVSWRSSFISVPFLVFLLLTWEGRLIRLGAFHISPFRDLVPILSRFGG